MHATITTQPSRTTAATKAADGGTATRSEAVVATAQSTAATKSGAPAATPASGATAAATTSPGVLVAAATALAGSAVASAADPATVPVCGSRYDGEVRQHYWQPVGLDHDTDAG